MNKLFLKKNGTILGVLFMGMLVVSIFWLSKTNYLVLKQKEFNEMLMTTLLMLKTNVKVSTLINISLLSILYGFFHAAGPGHGKLLITGFLVNKTNKYKKAIIASFFTTITHVGVAIIISFLLKYVFIKISYFARINMLEYFKTISGIMIIIIGVVLLFTSTIKNRFKNKKQIIFNNACLTGIIAGAIPCPLSMTIMLISISYSIEYIGILLVAAIAVGILLFLLLFSMCFVCFREQSVLFFHNTNISIPFKLSYLQSCFYLAIGSILIFSS